MKTFKIISRVLLALLDVAICVLVVLVSGCATAPMTNGIPNLAQVEPGVWRGGQPNEEGWAWLTAQGVTWDIKLNTWDEAQESVLTNVWKFWDGLSVDDEPITWAEQLFEANGYAIDNAVQRLTAHPSGGVFVHCQHGQDRTGLIIGVYRVRIEHWKKAAAYREMLSHGFHPALFGLQRYWDKEVHEK